MTVALVDRVRARLVETRSEPTPTRVAALLRSEGLVLGDGAVLGLVGELRAELAGAGPLESLLADSRVTDVLVNGPSEVWIDRGMGLERTEVRFASEESVLRLAQRLAAGVGRRLDEASPYVDAHLPNGTRVHAVIPPIARGGTFISLRVPRARAFTLDELVSLGSVDLEGAAWLRAIMAARLSFLISGGTGAGKTTVLAALLGLCEPGERLLIVEDSAELNPDHNHVVRLEARVANTEGAGRVTMTDLVRQSLRMRPDRVVVGEARGAEIVDFLAALNTGHEGGCGTLHANSIADVPARLEALGLTAGLDRAAIHALAASGVQVLIHVERQGHVRRISQLGVLCRGSSGDLEVTDDMATLCGLIRARGVEPPC